MEEGIGFKMREMFYCIDCNKEISRSGFDGGQKCHSCANRISSYIHGQTYLNYPQDFKFIGKSIRFRDDYICQYCGMIQDEHRL